MQSDKHGPSVELRVFEHGKHESEGGTFSTHEGLFIYLIY